MKAKVKGVRMRCMTGQVRDIQTANQDFLIWSTRKSSTKLLNGLLVGITKAVPI
jgi:hypothetical protein